jgi:hypothetical protein
MQRIHRIGQAAAWLTVAVMASVTTLGVMAIALGPSLRNLLVDRPLIAVLVGIVAITPWWTLAAVLGQQRRVPVQSR